MPIYYEPDYERQAFQRGVGGLGNLLTSLAFMKMQQNWEAKQAEIAEQKALTREQRQFQVGRQAEGWQMLAPSKAEYSARPVGGTDVQVGPYGAVWQEPAAPQVPKTLQGKIDYVKVAPGRYQAVTLGGWEPRTKEEAIEMKRMGLQPTGWKPQSKEEAIEVRKAGRQPSLTFEQQKELARIRRGDEGQPKGRTAEANWWAGQLGVDLKTKGGRAAVNQVMDKLYGRADTEKKMFLDAFRAARDPLLDPQENIAAAQELYNKLQTSDKNREFILEQEPDAKYDYGAGRWYVMHGNKKIWLAIEE